MIVFQLGIMVGMGIMFLVMWSPFELARKKIKAMKFALEFCRKNFEELQEGANLNQNSNAFVFGVCKNGLDGIKIALYFESENIKYRAGEKR